MGTNEDGRWRWTPCDGNEGEDGQWRWTLAAGNVEAEVPGMPSSSMFFFFLSFVYFLFFSGLGSWRKEGSGKEYGGRGRGNWEVGVGSLLGVVRLGFAASGGAGAMEQLD
eukprot:TRINITY_DN8050_c2_g1_i1.p3 TRINITY_DN8050_c2_g1~~TRINITY_DN8050_c2_g1_i1.p3  ORF type:complete len:110 (-),score=18.69 TRINITY_DN8050_c2_g1_i1:453-782(-)